MHSRSIRALCLLAIGASGATAQTIDDGLLMPTRTVGGGVVFAHDSWDQYWEGTLKRSNGNIGTLTTQSVTLMAGYGITDRLNVMAMLPYIRTEASQGTLRGQSGIQDITLAAKYRLLRRESATAGVLSGYVVATAALPVGDYTPDFMPMSIGTAGGRAAGRLTLNLQSNSFWFVNATGAYTFCNNVTLDRSAYYTDGQLYMTNEVAMPNVVDYSFTAGVHRGRWRVPVSIVQQRTLGGGDIRRQDMPFVSNRMDFVRLDGSAIYDLPKNLSLRLGAAHVLSGRNVGQSTTINSGLFYAFHF
jgi:hypothetical protein